MSSNSFKKFIRYFQNQGYPYEYLRTIDLEPNEGSNIRAAEDQIAPFIEKMLQEINDSKSRNENFKFEKISIVAHSMGSMSSRWYIAKVRPERISIWISLAGPNHGSNIQCPGTENSGKRELCPAFAKDSSESNLQFALNGTPGRDIDETPYGVGRDSYGVHSIKPDSARKIYYWTVRTEPDEWIDPVSSTILDGTGDGKIEIPVHIPAIEIPSGNFLMMKKVTHDGLLEDHSVHALVYHLLNNPERQ